MTTNFDEMGKQIMMKILRYVTIDTDYKITSLLESSYGGLTVKTQCVSCGIIITFRLLGYAHYFRTAWSISEIFYKKHYKRACVV